MLFNKKWQVYTYTRNTNQVSTYTAGATFACNIQPVGTKDGFEGTAMYNVKKMYTKKALAVGDKVAIDGIDYIVNSIENWQGTKRDFYKVIIQKSNGS